MSQSITVLSTVGALAASVGAALASLISSRSTSGKTNTEAKILAAKSPAEIDSVVVEGAERAVLTMGKALDSANARIDELEELRTRDRKIIEEMSTEMRALRNKAERAERTAAEARRELDSLTRKFEQITADRKKP